jgi:hypothetical protein
MVVSTWYKPHYWQGWKINENPKATFAAYFANSIYGETTGYAVARINRSDLSVKWQSKNMPISRAARLAELLSQRVSRYYHLSNDDLLAKMLQHPNLTVDWEADLKYPREENCPDCGMKGSHYRAKTPYGEAHLVLVKSDDGDFSYTVHFLSEYLHNATAKQARKFILDKVRAWNRADCCQVVGV